MNIRIPFLLAIFGIAIPSAAHGQTVTSAADLQAALNTSATPATTSGTIVFGNSISLSGYSAAGYNAGSGFLGAINAPTGGAVLTVNGGGNSLTGGSNALFFASPENETATGGVSNPTPQNVTIENLTISGATSQGGASSFGGGGAGLGGGLFVGTGVNMTLNAVTFNGNLAVGGSSIFGGNAYGGGGIGGNAEFFGGGGLYATPTNSYSGGGANGGQGFEGGSGGFGGGGAYGNGAGGFGAGGSSGEPSGFGAGAGYANTAGFGGGGGYDTTIQGAGGVGGGTFNGGGAGFGGAIFVQNGANLTLTGNDTLSGDTATGGAGTTQGAGVGNEIFMMTGSSVTLAPGSGNTVTIGASGNTGDNIADDSVSSLPTGRSYIAGAAAGAGLVLGSSANPNGTVVLYGNNTYAGGTTLQDGATLVVGSSHALGVGALTTTGNTVVYVTGVTVSNPIVMTGDTALEVDDLGSATQGGVISESGGVHSITKTGTGTLILTKANTYSGGTTINSGILEAQNNSALGTGAVTVGSGTSLQLTGGIALSNNITISGTGAGGAGAIFSTDGLPGNSVNGTVTLAADASVNNVSSPYALAVAGTVALGAHDLTLAGGGNIILSGRVTGTGGLTVAANTIGFLNGSTANTYSGLTTVSAGGLLDIAKTTGPAMAGNLDISGTVEDYLSGQLPTTAVVTLSGTGLFNFRNQGTTETIAGLDGTSGTEITPFINGGGNTLNIAGSGNYSFAGRIEDKSPTGSGSSSVALAMQGSGTQVLTGASNYSGGTTISAGVLQLGDGFTAGASLGSGHVTVNGTGIFTLDLANNETFSNNIINNNQVVLDDFVSSNYTVSSFISGTGSVLKTGANTITVTGNNNYSGGTTVNAGTLVAGNASAFGTGRLQVSGGNLTVGNGNHTISVNSYAQTAGTLLLNVSGVGPAATVDLLHVTNTLASQVTLGGNLTINLAGFTVPAGATHGTYTFTLVATDAGYTDKFASFDALNLGSGLTARLNYKTTPDDVLVQIFQAATSFALTGLTPNQQAVADNINQNIALGHISGHVITGLQNQSAAALPAAFDELSPLPFGQFAGTTAANNASFDTEAQDNYAASRRGGPNGTFLGGNGGIDASGLTLNDPSYDPALAMVHSRLLAWNPGPFTVSDIANPVLGGIGMKDPKDMKSMAAPAYSNPWNFYVRGNVVLAQGFSDPDVSHFDDNTESVVLGTDYRLTQNFLVGLTAGYGHTDVTLDNAGSSATVDSYSPGLYASYADRGWYANASGNYTHNAYTQSRVISFLGQTATSAPEGNEGVANLDGGYDFHRGALTFGPLVGLQYTHLTVDGYNEAGSDADLNVSGQDADSLRSRLGGRVSFAFSHCGMSFTPHLDASWQHEFLEQSRGITSQFNGGVGSFNVQTTNPSRDSALVDAGLDAEINRTVTVFGDYMIQAGQDNYFGQSIQGGVKIGF
jgi:autotransporter-associated beta strand protein